MKAIRYKAFGGPEVLELVELEKPSLKAPDDVLVRVKAFTVNPLDMKIRSGRMQQIFPAELPFTPGLDAAGVVEAIGSDVKLVKVGDEVIATSMSGTYAEYAVVKEGSVSQKPKGLSFLEASAVPVPVGTAHAVLVTAGQLRSGERVLVQGAAGAVGNLVVQMAKALGAYVIGTATGSGLALIKELGADEAIDYKAADPMRSVSDIDLVADLVGGETQQRSFATMKSGGRLISTVMPPSQELAQQHGVTAVFHASDLSADAILPGMQLLAAGKLKPIVAQVLPWQEAAQAQELVMAGGVNGKVVLEVE